MLGRGPVRRGACALASLLAACASPAPPHEGGATAEIEEESVEARQALAPSVAGMETAELIRRLPSRADTFTFDGTQWNTDPVAAELGRRAQEGLLSDADWRAILLGQDVFHMRARWPARLPLEIWIRGLPWLPQTLVVARATDPDLGTIAADDRFPHSCGTCLDFRESRQRFLELGPLPRGTERVHFDIAIDVVPTGDSFLDRLPERALWRGELDVPVSAVASPEEAMPGTSRPEVADAIRDSLEIDWWEEDDRSTPHLGLRFDAERLPTVAGVACHVRFELLRDGDVVETGELLQYAGEPLDRVSHWQGCYSLGSRCGLSWLPSEEELVGAELERWSVRLQGTWEEALALWDAGEWWSGSLEVSLGELIERGRARD